MTFVLRPTQSRRLSRGLVLILVAVLLIYYLQQPFEASRPRFNYVPLPIHPERYPVSSTLHLPRTRPTRLPRIQHAPVPETQKAKELRQRRQQEVRQTFLHAWTGYKSEAWSQDELRPVSGGFKSPFCGWAATMVDSLDTLYIMGLHEDFEMALLELHDVDFTHTEGCTINLFETTIRHLGGLLAAYDVSGNKHPILLQKAVELAEILYTAFDTPNRMPSPHYLWSASDETANAHQPSNGIVLAVLGTLSLEFTRLSQLTKNDKYFDGIQRIINELEMWQDNTTLPGMWPSTIDAARINQTIALGSPYEDGLETFTLGALADSAYEYLPKQYMLLGGRSKQYRNMYEKFVKAARKYLFFRPMTVGDKDILLSGSVAMRRGGEQYHDPRQEHLGCFTGGMLAIAGKIFDLPDDLEDGRRLADGCVWAYKNTVTGIMPECFTAVPCANRSSCAWNETAWFYSIERNTDDFRVREVIKELHLPPGFANINDKRYLLRPEAIESVFILYRITGDQYWAESGWDMFKSIQAHTTTSLAHSAIDDVTSGAPIQTDEMESFWLAETLKYFYLLFCDTNTINLDEYVFNTEAHPLRRPK